MTYLDITFIIVLGGFVLAGFWFGFIHMVGSIIGLVVGAVAAGQFYPVVAGWLAPVIPNQNAAKVIGFLLIFIILPRLIGLLFALADKIFKIIAVIPFLRTFNRLLGALLGLIEGTFLIGLAVWFIARFPFTAAFADVLRTSATARSFYSIGALLSLLLPGALKAMQSVF